jgi:uncharacterized membrane protein YkoI
MNRQTALLISVFVTMFILVIVGGVVLAMRPAQPSTDVAALEAAYKAREASYAELLTQANQRLEEANQQITVLSGQSGGVVQASQASASPYAISSQKALEIASLAVGTKTAPKGEPQVVNYENTAAYEVPFDKGNVYVDASSGKVLHNGVPQEITQEQAGQIAINYLKGGKVYKIEKSDFKGEPVYKVTFWAGFVVDVNMNGQVVYVKLVRENTISASSGDDGGSGGGGAKKPKPENHDDDHGDD